VTCSLDGAHGDEHWKPIVMRVQLAARQLFPRHAHQKGNGSEHIAERADIDVLVAERLAE